MRKKMENNDETVFSLMAKVIENEKITHNEKIQLLDEIRKARPALEDRWIYRWVVNFIGISLLLTVVVITICIFKGESNIPDGVIAIGSGALGALSSLLANRPKPVEEKT